MIKTKGLNKNWLATWQRLSKDLPLVNTHALPGLLSCDPVKWTRQESHTVKTIKVFGWCRDNVCSESNFTDIDPKQKIRYKHCRTLPTFDPTNLKCMLDEMPAPFSIGLNCRKMDGFLPKSYFQKCYNWMVFDHELLVKQFLSEMILVTWILDRISAQVSIQFVLHDE